MPTRREYADPDQQRRWEESRRRVGANVRRLRLEAGLTQEALALESGLSRNQLIELEHGRRGVLFERLEDLAVTLNVEPSVLLRSPAEESPEVEPAPGAVDPRGIVPEDLGG